MNVVVEMMPSLRNRTVSGIETINKTTGMEYKIITVDKGVINQVIAHYTNTTKEVTLISTT